MAAGFLFKPIFDSGSGGGGLIYSGGSTPSSVTATLPDGTVIQGQLGSSGEHGWKVGLDGAASYPEGTVITIQYTDGSVGTHNIVAQGQRQEYPAGSVNPDSIGGLGSVGPGGAGIAGVTGGGVDANGVAIPFYNPNYPQFPTVPYHDIEAADYNFVDPMKVLEEFGPVATDQYLQNYGISKDLALDQLNTELEGLYNYVPAAAALKREQVAIDNVFNQSQRLAQVNAVIPEAQQQLKEQGERAEVFAKGRFTSDIEDRGFEIGNRSDAADLSRTRGFGDDSVIGRKVSDLLAAEKRLDISKYGDQLLTGNIQTKANLYLAPTEYSDAGGQIRVQPTQSAPQLQNQLNAQLNELNNISANTALSSLTGQEQFKTNLTQRSNEFNAANQINIDQYNSTGTFNAALGAFNYDNGYLNAVSQATNQGTNLGITEEISQEVQDAIAEAAEAQDWQTLAGLLGQVLGGGLKGPGAAIIDNILEALGIDIIDRPGEEAEDANKPKPDKPKPNKPKPKPDSNDDGQPGTGGVGGDSGSSGDGGINDPTDSDGDGIPDVSDDFPDDPYNIDPNEPAQEGPTTAGVSPNEDNGIGGMAEEDDANPPPGTRSVRVKGDADDGSDFETPPSKLEGKTLPVAPLEGDVESQPPIELNDSGFITSQRRFTNNRSFNDSVDPETKKILDHNAEAAERNTTKFGESLGVSYRPGPNKVQVGVDERGRRLYADRDYIKNGQGIRNATAGDYLSNYAKLVGPFNVFNPGEQKQYLNMTKQLRDPQVMSILDGFVEKGDYESFSALFAPPKGDKGKRVEEILRGPNIGKQAANFTASTFWLYNHWDSLSDFQKGLGLTKLGIKGFELFSGSKIGSRVIPGTAGGTIKGGITVSEGLGLFAQGYNVYDLVKNWDKYSTLAKTYGVVGNAKSIAEFLKRKGVLGNSEQASQFVKGLGTAASALQIATTVKNWNSYSNRERTLYGAQAAANGVNVINQTGAALGNTTPIIGGNIGKVAGEAGTYISVGMDLYAGYNALTNSNLTDEQRAAEFNWQMKKAVADYYTAGAASAIDAAAQHAFGKEYNAYRAADQRYNPLTRYETEVTASYLDVGRELKEGDIGSAVVDLFAGYGKGIRSAFQGVKNIFGGQTNVETGIRQDLRKSLSEGESPFFQKDENGHYTLTLADGTVTDFVHWDGKGEKKHYSEGLGKDLHPYDTDYTNDLDYMSGMGGRALSTLLFGGTKNNPQLQSEIDKMGGLFGNTALENIGHNKDMGPKRFEKAMENMRAFYAQSGITSREMAYGLAQSLFDEGKIDMVDLIQMHQSFNMVFDEDRNAAYNTALTLAGGRNAWWGSVNENDLIRDSEGTPVGVRKPYRYPEGKEPKHDWKPMSEPKPWSRDGSNSNALSNPEGANVQQDPNVTYRSAGMPKNPNRKPKHKPGNRYRPLKEEPIPLKTRSLDEAAGIPTNSVGKYG